MLNHFIRTIIIFSTAAFVQSCSYIQVKDDPGDPARYVMWFNSDIQSRTPEQLYIFEDAVTDIVNNIGRVDMAITAGDIVEKKDADFYYDHYLKTRKAVNAGTWFEIAGNHENRDIEGYRRNIRKELNYAVSAGNLIIIFMSATKKEDISPIPDDVVAWWKKIVMENQDKIIITVTHIALEQSGLIHGQLGMYPLYIENSKDFEEFMKTYRVDIWFSGHAHIPGFIPYTEFKNSNLNGTVFIDTSSIRNENFKDIESRIVVFRRGSKKFIVKHRNHTKKKYSIFGDKVFTLPYPFEMGQDEKPVIFSSIKSQVVIK